MKSLFELYREHRGKSSDKWSIYLLEYDRIFSSYRDKPVRMLEIGIQNGGSLEIWGKYFSNAHAFVGCDINPDCAGLSYEDPRIKVVVGDANTDETEAVVLGYSPQFDLIIDDGSHTSGDIVQSFARYFRHLSHGGLFVAEDLHCSYWSNFEGGLYYPYSSISFFKRLADVVNHEHWGIEKERKQLLQGFTTQFNASFDESDLAEIHSIEFFNSVCVVHKRPCHSNILGERFIAGVSEIVVSGHQKLTGSSMIAQDQNQNFWAAMETAPAEDWYRLSKTLVERDTNISTLREEISNLKNDNISLRSSTSWRLTKPVRFFGHLIARCKHLYKIAPSVIRIGGGVSSTLRKALDLYRQEGISGIKRGIQIVQNYGTIRPTFGSGGYDRNDYAEWVRRYDTIDENKREKLSALCEALAIKPKISVVMPTYNPKPEWLIEAIESVRGQIYPNWELCIADDASPDQLIWPILERYAREDERIKVIRREKNGHICSASNSALKLATGEWVALLDHDDILPAHALALVAKAINSHPRAGLIYSDEDKLDESGQRSSPYFKCEWNLELFRSQNMISHLGVYRRELLTQVNGFRVGYEGSQDYDLALRVIESLEPDQIIHIPHVLYHWRIHSDSTASCATVKTYAQDSGVKALQDHFGRLSIDASVELTSFLHHRVRYCIPTPSPKVSLIILNNNCLKMVSSCVESILGKTTYPNYEILIINNGLYDQEAKKYFDKFALRTEIKIIRDDRPFNYSMLYNMAVDLADGEYVGLINADIEVITPEWLNEMVSLAAQPGSGAVGACLWYPNKTLQHGGIVLGIDGVAVHAHRGIAKGTHGYFGRAALTQRVSAVTSECLVVKKSIYLDVGGFNERDLAVSFKDVDFCLKVKKAGFQNIWTPFAEHYHHDFVTSVVKDTEKKSICIDDINYMKNIWGDVLLYDPAYSPNLTLYHEDFSLAWPPRALDV